MSENVYDFPIPDPAPYRCFIRTDAGNRIVGIYGLNPGEEPGEGMIFLHNYGAGGPKLFPEAGPEFENTVPTRPAHKGFVYLYKYENGAVVARTEAEIAADAEALRIAALPGEVRDKRDRLLKESDWSQLPDVPLSDAKKEEWATYRQALRDITDPTSQPGFPTDVNWPAKPE
jgi:hypothetical protein